MPVRSFGPGGSGQPAGRVAFLAGLGVGAACLMRINPVIIASLAAALTLSLLVDVRSAEAQGHSATCSRLEAQLASASRRDSGRSTRRYDSAIGQQERALRQTERMARRSGCNSRRNRRSGQCPAIISTIGRMEQNLVQLRRKRDRASGGGGRDLVRQIKAQLKRNNCYGGRTRTARSKDRGGNLFGALTRRQETRSKVTVTRGERSRQTATVRSASTPGYRTVCVRTCDGYFFPVSFSTTKGRIGEDKQQCASMCAGASTELFMYQLPMETLEDARSVDGKSYSELPNAFRFQREFVNGCSCQERDANSMLEAVRQQKAGATAGGQIAWSEPPGIRSSDAARDFVQSGSIGTSSAQTSKPSVDPTRQQIVMTVIEEAVQRDAKTGLRDVYLKPNVDEEQIKTRHVISFETFPPLPLRRPDPLAGKQLSDAR